MMIDGDRCRHAPGWESSAAQGLIQLAAVAQEKLAAHSPVGAESEA